jgi:hypothetical protein
LSQQFKLQRPEREGEKERSARDEKNKKRRKREGK